MDCMRNQNSLNGIEIQFIIFSFRNPFEYRYRGNVGQQVEILASDELNGEYKPLTYFTLPSTEYIYNDNRTNKVKQYYKVR